MAIILNDNIRINAGKPSEPKYLTTGNTVYASCADVTSSIPVPERHVGLTVLINSGGTNVEYWFKNGVSNSNLIEKKFNTIIPIADFITGATNLGYFSGFTGVQTLPLTNLANSDYDGNYYSVYNNYYRDGNGVIQVGEPHDAFPKRGYVRQPTLANPTYKSWIWNEYTGGSNQLGWILIDGNVTELLGTFQPGVTYYPPSSAYVQTAWVTGSNPNNGSNVVISTITGSLTTGNTLTIGGRLYAFSDHNNLHFRGIYSETPNIIAVRDDDTFIYISGASAILGGQNIGTGVPVLASPVSGTTLQFRSIVGSGSTTVVQKGNSIVVFSTGGTGGGTTGGTYNLTSPAALTVGGIAAGTVLTGKTSFQLFEALLVPELCGVITAPSTSIGLSASGLYEVDCCVNETVTATFNRGSINPQYCSVSPFRSGCANAYCFVGAGMPVGFQSCSSSPAVNTVFTYPVVIGTQTWSVCTRYNAGTPALGSKGTQFCAALASGSTAAVSGTIIGVYPLWGTTVAITTMTKQPLQDMSTANNIQLNLVAESGGNKQRFEIPCSWLAAPTNRPLTGVCQWNTVSSQWEYPGGTAPASLTVWTATGSTETVQGNPISYCRYTYNGVDRSAVCIRLVF